MTLYWYSHTLGDPSATRTSAASLSWHRVDSIEMIFPSAASLALSRCFIPANSARSLGSLPFCASGGAPQIPLPLGVSSSPRGWNARPPKPAHVHLTPGCSTARARADAASSSAVSFRRLRLEHTSRQFKACGRMRINILLKKNPTYGKNGLRYIEKMGV